MIADYTRHIGVLLIHLYIPSSQSLKEKRMVLKSLKDKVRTKFNISIAELDGEDKWQTATCGISMIGNDQRYMDSCFQNILSYIDSMDAVQITEQEMEFF